MLHHVARQRHRQIKPQAQVVFAALKPINLLLGLAASLREQHLAQLNIRRIKRRETIALVHRADNPQQSVKLNLFRRQILIKPARQTRRRNLIHISIMSRLGQFVKG